MADTAAFRQRRKLFFFSPHRLRATFSKRPFISAAPLAVGAALFCAIAPAATQARPIAYAVCVPSNHTDPPCPSSYHLKGIIVIDRMNFSGMSSFSRTYSYDPAVLAFHSQETSLLCDLRSASAVPYCPDFPAGSDTEPLSVFPDTFTVDQTNLVIHQDASGLPSVTLDFTAPAGTALIGERNFLALAFDLLVPLEKGASVTYGTPPLANQTFLSGAILCRDSAGATLDCAADNPPAAFALHPVPAPLAAGGLPILAAFSRRLRQRIRRAAA